MSDWTADDLATAIKTADGLEIAGCVDTDGQVIRCDNGERAGERCDDSPVATFWSVYIWREGQGADCIADRCTVEAARAFAAELAARHGLPILDCA